MSDGLEYSKLMKYADRNSEFPEGRVCLKALFNPRKSFPLFLAEKVLIGKR